MLNRRFLMIGAPAALVVYKANPIMAFEFDSFDKFKMLLKHLDWYHRLLENIHEDCDHLTDQMREFMGAYVVYFVSKHRYYKETVESIQATWITPNKLQSTVYPKGIVKTMYGPSGNASYFLVDSHF